EPVDPGDLGILDPLGALCEETLDEAIGGLVGLDLHQVGQLLVVHRASSASGWTGQVMPRRWVWVPSPKVTLVHPRSVSAWRCSWIWRVFLDTRSSMEAIHSTRAARWRMSASIRS